MNYYHLISRTSLRLLHSASQFDEKEDDEVVEEVEDELFAEIFSSSCRWSASLSFLPAWEMVRLIKQHIWVEWDPSEHLVTLFTPGVS